MLSQFESIEGLTSSESIDPLHIHRQRCFLRFYVSIILFASAWQLILTVFLWNSDHDSDKRPYSSLRSHLHASKLTLSSSASSKTQKQNIFEPRPAYEYVIQTLLHQHWCRYNEILPNNLNTGELAAAIKYWLSPKVTRQLGESQQAGHLQIY